MLSSFIPSNTKSFFSFVRDFVKVNWHDPKPWDKNDKRTEYQKLLASDFYIPTDKELDGLKLQCRRATERFNQKASVDRPEERHRFLVDLIGGQDPEGLYIESPIYFDYGIHVKFGKNIFINWGCTILDGAPVEIGDNTMFAPNVSIYTATHPTSGKARKAGPEYAQKVTIGKNCWIGGNAVIGPGVTIGDNVSVGAGSVVIDDIPSNSIVVGVPAKVIKKLPPE